MFRAGTPTDCTAAMISRMISGEEQQAGAPDGLILMPTMSLGSMNFAQASREDVLARQFFHRPLEHTAHNRLRNAIARDRIRVVDLDDPSGKNPGMPSGEGL